MLPQVGVGGATPKPKKLKLASTRMAVAVQRLLITRISPRILGKIWDRTILFLFAPRARTASI